MTDIHTPITLYGYWRSNATYRVRVALNLKRLTYTEIPIDLDAGAQHDPAFLARNPQGAVPAFVDDPAAAPITQSLAILEYLEERYPEPPLLPPDARGRARVRALCAVVAADTHPLIVPRVRRYLTTEAGLDADAFRAWLRTWVGAGLGVLETLLAGSAATGRFCHADEITMADICVAGLAMIPRVFSFDVPGTPTVDRIVAACLAEDAFARADPFRQADAPTAAA